MRTHLLWPWVVTLSAWAGSTARADDFRYRNVLIGDRALGMGGAFTAIADDPSAAYYNPAGLSLIESSSVSASLQVNSIDQRTVEDAYAGVGDQRADFEHSAQPTVPIFVSLVKKLGPKDAAGQQAHAVGVSTFHPARRTLRYAVALSALDPFDPNVRVLEDYRLLHEDTTSWFGPSYSFAPTSQLALGLSAFLSTRSVRHEESLSQVNVAADAMAIADTDFFLSQQSVLTQTHRHLVLRLGVMYAPMSQLQLGLMVQAPGIAISSDARLKASSLSAFPGTLPQFARTQQTLAASSPVPWEIRVGAGYFARGSDFKAGLDVSLHGPMGSASDPVQAIGSPQPDALFTNYVPWVGDFVVERFHRVMALNVALGMEATVANAVPLRVGLYTNRSAAPDVPRTSPSYVPDDVSQYGLSVSVGLRTGGYDLSIGGAALLGAGHGLRRLTAAEVDPMTNDSYGRTDITDTTLVFFLTGYRKALSRAARMAYQEL